MKKTIGSLLLVSVLVGLAPAPAFAWYCSARGTTGATGWGRAYELYSAKAIALRECSVRTPRYARCYIMYCN